MRGFSTRAAGLLVLLGGLWGGLAPFIGPYWHFTLGPDQTWTWTTGRLWLDVIPGVVAVIAGLMLIGAGPRPRARLGALLGLAAGIWFTIGPAISELWTTGGAQGVGHGSAHARMLENLTFHIGLGVLMAAIAAYILPRFPARVIERDVAVADETAGRRERGYTGGTSAYPRDEEPYAGERTLGERGSTGRRGRLGEDAALAGGGAVAGHELGRRRAGRDTEETVRREPGYDGAYDEGPNGRMGRTDEPGRTAREGGAYGAEPATTAREGGAYGAEPATTVREGGAYGNEPATTAHDAGAYGNEPATTANDRAYADEPSGAVSAGQGASEFDDGGAQSGSGALADRRGSVRRRRGGLLSSLIRR